MSAWQIAREQWLAWIEDDLALARHPSGPLDQLDAHLEVRLGRGGFVAAEQTLARPGVESSTHSFERRATLVRSTFDDDDDDDQTRIRPEPRGLSAGPPAVDEAIEPLASPAPDVLEVGLRVPEAGLEVSLHAPVGDTVVAPTPSGGTVIAPAPVGPSYDDPLPEPPPPAVEARGNRDDAAAEPTDAVDQDADDGLFIPTLTRLTPEPEPIPIDDVPEEPLDELPPVVSGQTVVGPPPVPPDEPAEELPIESAGVIAVEPDESAQTLIRGEIPSRDEAPPQAEVPRKSKVVIDPSASGVMSAVYDEEEPDEAVDDEPDELDADDLVEDDEDDDDEDEPTHEALPPPAPSRPPAREGRTVDIGPPPPPVSASNLHAALSALPAAPPVDEDWQVDAFGDHYAALVSPLRAGVVAGEVEFLAYSLGLGPGASVLDVGCGDGAHCVALGTRGVAVTGLDASPVQLMRASQAAQSAGIPFELISGDMRQPPVEGPFDAILCIGGTLGMYTDEDDRIALQHMRDRLVPGGRVMLHVLNRDYIVGRLPARSWWQGQGCLVLDEAQMFAPTSRVHVHRTVVFETGKQFEHNIALRLYGLTELVHMCAQVGLRVLEYSGSRHTRGRFYGATSSEVWLVAQRSDG
ncbi:SAM-dependent methyltransferase [Paraliomyxa miuraensis]|uniref:SAM-dependent methyltransferase n=1 Tax=Paraliomyxa miuraensis TaxID=376150 RepID=UPI00225B93F0|nr:class I SAM-dependent methyltransferase [Paraliomyxa miuraensis]MCX4242372.1 class I SAM-dependent methyltransferase [Paraliomyxa miuraensis]